MDAERAWREPLSCADAGFAGGQAVVAPRSVVVVNSFCRVEGGASRVAIDEAIGLARKGVAVTFVSAIGPVAEELAAAPVKVICLDQRELAAAPYDPEIALQGLWNRRAFSAMSKALRGLDPRDTIVHLHGFTQALSSSPVRCALELGFKVVSTLHEYFTACPNGGFFDYVAESPCHRRPLSIQCVATNCDKRRYIHKAYRVLRTGVQRRLGWLPGGVNHYIALSQRSVEVLRPYLPAEAKFFFLGNPIDVPHTPPVAVERNTDIIAIGRLSPEKGISLLVRAAKIANARVVLVGDGPLRSLAEESGVCRVTGWLPRAGVLAALESARCLVFPSLWYETFGLCVSEAAARGVPAIVSDTTGAAERIEHNRTGWHVRSGDAGELARYLRHIGNDEVVAAAGRAAYAGFWTQAPNLERHTEDLLSVYTQVLRS